MQKTYWSTNCHKIGYAPQTIRSLTNKDNGGTSVQPSHECMTHAFLTEVKSLLTDIPTEAHDGLRELLLDELDKEKRRRPAAEAEIQKLTAECEDIKKETAILMEAYLEETHKNALEMEQLRAERKEDKVHNDLLTVGKEFRLYLVPLDEDVISFEELDLAQKEYSVDGDSFTSLWHIAKAINDLA